MIRRNFLAWKKVLLAKSSLSITHHPMIHRFRRTLCLLSKETGSTFRNPSRIGSGCVQPTCRFRACQCTRFHHEGNFPKTQMSKTVVPPQELFLRFSQVNVVLRNFRNGCIQHSWHSRSDTVIVPCSRRQVVSRIHKCHHTVSMWISACS